MKVAIASCAKIQSQPVQPAWGFIEAEQPNLLLMLGDNVYGGSLSLSWRSYHKKLNQRYLEQTSEQNFARLISKVPFKAIWDDHDFAKGNDRVGTRVKGKQKKKSRELFHLHMNCSTNLPEVYYAFEMGNAKFIMLDVRYYREMASRTASILGKQQEQWLESELQHEKQFTMIGSGSCLTEGQDSWSGYNEYFERFSRLVTPIKNVFFLAGNIHKNLFREHDACYEVISSAVGRKNRDNYGIVELLDDKVHIRLCGNKARDRFETTLPVAP